jgi:peptidoglycan/xylan/chitin deacetylase (PgdA/CDA1 family)
VDREVTIVLYHHISSDNDRLTNQLNVSTSPELFEQHIRYFSRHFDFISAKDLSDGLLPRKPLLITFDDAYKSVLAVAGPILKGKKVPSLFFVNAASVVTDELPIDNLVSLAVQEFGLTKVVSFLRTENSNIASVNQIFTELFPKMPLAALKVFKYKVLSELAASEKQIREESKLFMSAHDIKNFGLYSIEIGNHSMQHACFRALSAPELHVEIVESQLALQRLSQRPVRFLSVPYGSEKDATKPALAVARASGHSAIFLVQARSNRFRLANDIYYRVSLENAALSSLPLKLQIAPILRSIRHCLS